MLFFLLLMLLFRSLCHQVSNQADNHFFRKHTFQVFFTFFQKFFFARSFCAVWFARRFYFALCGLKKSPEDLIYLLNIIFFAKGISQTN